MNNLKKLAAQGKIGRLCLRGAWIIAALGTLQTALHLYYIWQLYHQMQISQSGIPYTDMMFFLNYVSPAFGTAISTIFSFLILYAAGTIINTIFLKEDSDITVEPLKKDEVVSWRHESRQGGAGS